MKYRSARRQRRATASKREATATRNRGQQTENHDAQDYGRHAPPTSGRIRRRMPEGTPGRGRPKDLWEEAAEKDALDAQGAWDVQDALDAQNTPTAHPRHGGRQPARRRAKRAPCRAKPGGHRGAKRVILLALCAVGMLCVLGGVVLSIFLARSTRNDDLWLNLAQVPYRTETVLYYTDRATGEAAEYLRIPCTQHKTYVAGEAIPQTLRDAFVAVEDRNFYNHSGVDFRRTLFAVLNEIKYSLTGSYIGGDEGRKQGASTIDQQLIKNLTRDDDDLSLAGYLRKIREIFRALRMDAQYDKDTILNAYLNTISFTGNTAGVSAEAQKLFNKDVGELTLAECASLAAITRNPANYNPVTHPEAHMERRNYVLDLMLEQGYIDQVAHDEASGAPLALDYQGAPEYDPPVTDYFTDTVIDAVVDELVAVRDITRRQATDLFYNGGLRIYTTVDPTLQRAMENVMETAAFYPRPGREVQVPVADENGGQATDENGTPLYQTVRELPQGAMVSLDYAGGICGVVGGLGEKDISRGFNRATSAVRQVGSTMKAISPYAVALERGRITWSSAFMDAPVTEERDAVTGATVQWPANVDNIYTNRDILVAEAFARSVNTVAVRVGERAGVSQMYNFVTKDLEISTFTTDDRDLGPLVLGSSTYGITPLEMARAYCVFGNGGRLPTVHCFTRIANGAGDVLLEKKLTEKQVLREENAYIMNRLMHEVVTGRGTASGMGVPGEMESVGKTGTTSDNRDHWFVGLTPYYVTASWYGYDANLPLAVNSRQHPPTLAWRRVMSEAQADLPTRSFAVPEGVVQREYCTVSGAAAGANCPSATGWYAAGYLPEERCPVHG